MAEKKIMYSPKRIEGNIKKLHIYKTLEILAKNQKIFKIEET